MDPQLVQMFGQKHLLDAAEELNGASGLLLLVSSEEEVQPGLVYSLLMLESM